MNTAYAITKNTTARMYSTPMVINALTSSFKKYDAGIYATKAKGITHVMIKRTPGAYISDGYFAKSAN